MALIGFACGTSIVWLVLNLATADAPCGTRLVSSVLVSHLAVADGMAAISTFVAQVMLRTCSGPTLGIVYCVGGCLEAAWAAAEAWRAHHCQHQ